MTFALLAAAATAPAWAQDGHAGHHPAPEAKTVLQTPSSIAGEHLELHETLARAVREGGALGAAAEGLEKALAPHFQREGEIATPPLSLLPQLASGPATAEMRAVLPMTQALERELPQMLREHQAIREALGKFRQAAETARREDYIRFCDQLAAHATQEEQVLYPTAILIGRYVDRTAPQR